MSRGAVFWGLLLIVVGSLFLLDNFNIIDIDLWQVIGPGFLILLGIWILIGPLLDQKESGSWHVPLNDAKRARVNLSYGAGRLKVSSGSQDENLLDGEFTGGVLHLFRADNDAMTLNLNMPSQVWPFFQLRDWNIRLNPGVPLDIEANVGAAESNFDLTDLQVKHFQLSTGASSTSIKLPAKSGTSKVVVKAGAASVDIFVPAGVAARIRSLVGLGSMSVDEHRFSRDKDGFSSSDYDHAENKIDLHVETGLGSVNIY
jgi:hypothetical protein